MSSVVKKSNGELLAKQIHDAMWERNITATDVAKKAQISRVTLYRYLKSPGTAPLSTILKICRVVGIQQITLATGGNYQ